MFAVIICSKASRLATAGSSFYLTDVLGLDILFEDAIRQLQAVQALQGGAGGVILSHPLVLPDLSNCGPAVMILMNFVSQSKLP